MIGLIYKVQPYQETNRMLFLYTPIGKKTLIARGSQRLSSELRIISQYLTEIEFYDNKKGIQPLRDAVLLNEFEEIKNDYFKTKDAAVMLEALDKVRDENLDHENIYAELILALNSKYFKEAVLSFLIKFISEAGFRPNLEGDGRDVIGFNLEKARLVYQGEKLRLDLNVKQVIILFKLLNLAMPNIQPIEENDLLVLQKFIKKYYEYHLEVSLKNI